MHASYAKAIPRAWRQTAALFVALGDAHRQRILLMFEPGERLRVGDIVAASTLSRTAVAHHLRVMRLAGVLKCEKIGKEVWHWPDTEAVRAGLHAVLDYLEQASAAPPGADAQRTCARETRRAASIGRRGGRSA